MRGDHKDSERTDRHSSRVASAASPVQKSPNTPTPAAQPVQNSPRTPTPAAQPVQNSPNTPKNAHFSPFYPSRENFVPLSPPCPPAGRTLYRSHHHDAQQGELCTAPSAKPGTKLSQHAHTSSPTGTKLSQHTPPAAQPVQNSPNTHRPTSLPRISSPSTPKNGVFRLFCACWASFVAHKQPTGHAGRVFSRSMVRTDSPGGSFHWDRLLEPMSVAHGCDNGETTAGGASLRCLLRRVGAWPGSTRTIQTRPIGGCHVADRAWLRRPWVPEGPGRASRSTTPSRQARVWRSRGQATAHRCHPRAHQAARPHSRIQQHLEHQLHPEHQRPTTTAHRCRPRAHQAARPHRHAPPDTRPETRHQARAQKRARNTSGPTNTHQKQQKAGRNLSVPARPRYSATIGATRQVAPRDRWCHATGDRQCATAVSCQ